MNEDKIKQELIKACMIGNEGARNYKQTTI
jgi:hypothetical protein